MEYYVDTGTGAYIGAWDDGNPDAPTTGVTEVGSAPADANDIWGFPGWTAHLPSAAEIKAEANRRIVASGHDWMAAREVGGGTIMPANIKTYAANIRDDSATLEATPVADYTDDSHWTAAL